MKPEASEVSEAREARGVMGLKKYMQGPDIRVYETDRTGEDIAVYRTDFTGGDSTQGEERKNFFWSKKKYWILAISIISLLLIALTLGVSLYFCLYSGKNVGKGNGKVLKEKKFFHCLFLESANLNNSTSAFPGKYLENIFEDQ